jgi:hypothetical protein
MSRVTDFLHIDTKINYIVFFIGAAPPQVYIETAPYHPTNVSSMGDEYVIMLGILTGYRLQTRNIKKSINYICILTSLV